LLGLFDGSFLSGRFFGRYWFFNLFRRSFNRGGFFFNR
jgi:hypothetical protein